MKNLIHIIYIAFLTFFISDINAQLGYFHFNQPQQFTNGYVDKNPSFGRRNTYMDSFYWLEFDILAFERKINLNDSSTQICVAKIKSNSMNSVTYITNNNYINKNPSLAYYIGFDYTMNAALVVWESIANGRSDIYGRTYNHITGWGTTFPIDTTNANKYNPSLYADGDSTYYISYESAGEIIFKIIKTNILSSTYSINLTESDTAYCSKPVVSRNFAGIPYPIIVTYQRRKPNFENAIYYRKQIFLQPGFSSIDWSNPDTVYTTGDNRNSEIYDDWSLNFNYSFDNFRNGKWNTLLSQYSLQTNPDKNNTQLVCFINGDFSDFYVRHFVYREQGSDSIKLKLPSVFNSETDSITIGDTSSNQKITMNNASSSKNWVFFDKVIGVNSSLYGVSITNDIITGTQNSETTSPENFHLNQNYPNPFNPKTNIVYELPFSNYVTLKVYDINGNEIVTLVNKNQPAGKYIVEFDGENLASGLYFYKLKSGNFTETKKMLLLK